MVPTDKHSYPYPGKECRMAELWSVLPRINKLVNLMIYLNVLRSWLRVIRIQWFSFLPRSLPIHVCMCLCLCLLWCQFVYVVNTDSDREADLNTMYTIHWYYVIDVFTIIIHHWPWWRHQMETFSALLVICAGNSPVPGEFPAQRPVMELWCFSLISVWINGWVNSGGAGDLRRYCAHYDVTVMTIDTVWYDLNTDACTDINRYT